MPVEKTIALTFIFSFFTRQYSTTPSMEGRMLITFIPQEEKPTVRMNAKVETLLQVALKTAYSARMTRPTRPMFRKVAA